MLIKKTSLQIASIFGFTFEQSFSAWIRLTLIKIIVIILTIFTINLILQPLFIIGIQNIPLEQALWVLEHILLMIVVIMTYFIILSRKGIAIELMSKTKLIRRQLKQLNLVFSISKINRYRFYIKIIIDISCFGFFMETQLTFASSNRYSSGFTVSALFFSFCQGIFIVIVDVFLSIYINTSQTIDTLNLNIQRFLDIFGTHRKMQKGELMREACELSERIDTFAVILEDITESMLIVKKIFQSTLLPLMANILLTIVTQVSWQYSLNKFIYLFTVRFKGKWYVSNVYKSRFQKHGFS